MKLEHPEKSAKQQGSSAAAPLLSRRKLIQTGLAGAPVLMALKSVPALAAECKRPSGFSASGNLSRNGTTPCSPKVSGISFWTNYATNNPTDATLDKQFNSVFSSTVTQSFREILSSGSPIQRKIVAAWLSANVGSTSLFSADEVKKMWDTGIVANAYQPTLGVTWNAAQVETYLDYVLLP
ncbi:MAG: hypothetical protein JSR83_25795 [Proteobacteria bacterium]|nr:hypothetical protein [Pseudomonadota bacterium]